MDSLTRSKSDDHVDKSTGLRNQMSTRKPWIRSVGNLTVAMYKKKTSVQRFVELSVGEEVRVDRTSNANDIMGTT